jgi:predicted nucleic acid-binding protein
MLRWMTNRRGGAPKFSIFKTQGALGLVLVAKQQGLVPAARPVLEPLKRAGIYLSDRLEDQILAAAGESP